MMKKACELCSHSPAAHIDRRCALCGCTSEPRTFVQESLGFRSSLPLRNPLTNTRKR